MLRAQGSVFSNIKPIEKRWIRTNLKKALQHAHVQGFSETSWAREEIHLINKMVGEPFLLIKGGFLHNAKAILTTRRWFIALTKK